MLFEVEKNIFKEKNINFVIIMKGCMIICSDDAHHTTLFQQHKNTFSLHIHTTITDCLC